MQNSKVLNLWIFLIMLGLCTAVQAQDAGQEVVPQTAEAPPPSNVESAPAVVETPAAIPPELQAPDQPIEVKFRDEDLPMESVTPIVDSPKAVMAKKIKFESRFEFTGMYSWIVDEMLVNSSQFGVKFSYHIDELNGAGLIFQTRVGNKTQYSEQFSSFSAKLQFDRAPSPSTMIGVGFDQKFYYGKVSVGKEKVMPVVTESNYVIGLQKQGSQQMPVLSIGLTQRFFVATNVSVGIGYKALFQQIYDPTSVNVRESEPIPPESAFSKKIQSSQVLGISTSFLF